MRGLRTRRRSGTASGPIRLLPSAVAVPADVADVSLLAAWSAGRGIPLVPRGAGTGMPGGNVGPGVVVDLSRLATVRTEELQEGRVWAGAGAVAGTVQGLAAGAGWFIPPLPSSADRCTLGGMVANNAAGVRTFLHGSTHAWVDALEVVLADGSVLRLASGATEARFDAVRASLLASFPGGALPWPHVRKNSSGYALDRFLPQGDPVALLLGSEGTLGLITEVALRLAPAPEARALVLVPVPEEEALDRMAPAVRALGASAFEFLGRRFLDIAGLRQGSDFSALAGNHPALALVEVAGSREQVEAGVAGMGALAREMGVSTKVGRTPEAMASLWKVRHAASPVVAARAAQGLVSMQFIEDSVVPDGRLSHYLAGLDAILSEEETDAVVFGHAGDGNVHVNPLVDVRRRDWRRRVARILDRTVDLVASLGGTLAGEHGDGRLRSPYHARIFGHQVSGAFAVVKDALDPSGMLNPGVVVAREGQDPLQGLSPRRGVR